MYTSAPVISGDTQLFCCDGARGWKPLRNLLAMIVGTWLRTTDCVPAPRGACAIELSDEPVPEQPANRATAAATPSAYPIRVGTRMFDSPPQATGNCDARVGHARHP